MAHTRRASESIEAFRRVSFAPEEEVVNGDGDGELDAAALFEKAAIDGEPDDWGLVDVVNEGA